jgi:hypothetical protein
MDQNQVGLYVCAYIYVGGECGCCKEKFRNVHPGHQRSYGRRVNSAKYFRNEDMGSMNDIHS